MNFPDHIFNIADTEQIIADKSNEALSAFYAAERFHVQHIKFGANAAKRKRFYKRH